MYDEKKGLLLELANTARWRTQKAAQYFDDDRNLSSAVALRRVGEFVSLLPGDHVLFRRLTAASAVGLEFWAERQNLFLSRWGFHSRPTSADDFGPAFIAELSALADEFAAEKTPPDVV